MIANKDKAIARLLARTIKTESCWIFQGAHNGHGYIRISIESKPQYVHRLAHEVFIGPIPDGFEVDHVKAKGCTSTACINPNHLEAVPRTVNLERSDWPPNMLKKRTHCNNGHEYSKNNTYIDTNGARNCRICKIKYNEVNSEKIRVYYSEYHHKNKNRILENRRKRRTNGKKN